MSFRRSPTCEHHSSIAVFGGVICGSAYGTIAKGIDTVLVSSADSTGASSAGPRIAGSTPAKVPASWRHPVPTTITIYGDQPAIAVTGHRAIVAYPVLDANAVTRAGCTQSASMLSISTDNRGADVAPTQLPAYFVNQWRIQLEK